MPNYPGSTPYPSPNYQTGRTRPISTVVLHTTEGTTSGALDWLTRTPNSQGRVSAHYVISPDGEIYALVEDTDTAWHAGPSANPGSIGIEVVGRADNSQTWNPAVIESLSNLVAWLSETYGIPLVWTSNPADIPAGEYWPGFVAHSALDPARRTDPGRHFAPQRVGLTGTGGRSTPGGAFAVVALVTIWALYGRR